MQKITVQSVQEKQSKDGSKTFYILKDTKGAEVSTFVADVLALKPGTVIEAEIELSGKYANLKEFKVISVPEAPAAQAKPPVQEYRKGNPDERRSIERQVAAKLAFEYAPDEFNLRQILVRGEAIYQWISEGKLPPVANKPITEQDITALWGEDSPAAKAVSVKPSTGPAKPPVESKDTSDEKQGQPELTVTKETVDTVDLPALEFKNAGEFYTACKKYFNLMPSPVQKEIPDYDLTNAGQRKKAWQVIVGTYGPNMA